MQIRLNYSDYREITMQQTITRMATASRDPLLYFVCLIVLLMSTPSFAADMSFSAPSSLSDLVSAPIAVVAADFNNDGNKDLAVLSNGSSFIKILRNNGNGTFQSAGTFDTGLFNTTTLTVGDFNHDGKPDLAIISQSSESVTLLINNGTGGFSSASYASGIAGIKGAAAGDFNGDGWDDLALLGSNDSSISLHLNTHSGTFSVSPNSSASSASTIKSADFNHDGRSDLLVISTSAVSILLGQSNGSFTAGPSVTASFPLSAAMADFDGDGFSDLAIVRSNGTAFVLPGNGDGSFGLQVPVTTGLSPNDIAAADFNNDGKIDLIFTDNQFFSGSELALALNTTTHLWSAAYPKAGTASTSSIQLLAKLLVAGKVYAVCQPNDFFAAPPPTSAQVRNGQDGFGNSLSDNLKGSVTVAANSETSISCSFLSPTTVYDVYVAAEATTPPYLQATPIKITIATAPETPTLDAAASVTARGFTASWNGVAFATSYRLDVSPDAGFSTFAPGFNNLDVGLTNPFAVTGLTPGTTYYVRVRAVFSGSASTSSNIKSLTTLPVPTAPILSAATGVTAYSFTANWGAVANATSYSIDVASDADFSTLINIYSNWNTGSATSYPVYVITPGSTYYYRVRSNDSIESSNSSIPAAITLPPTAPFAYKAAMASTSGFIAAWTSSAGASGYRLDVASDPGFSTYLPGYTNRDVGNVLSLLVSGTTPGVPCYFRVRAYNSGPYVSSSQTITVSVPAVPPVNLYAPRAYLTGSGPSSSVSADFNGDGVLDVAVANRTSNTVTILIGTGDGLFTEAASYASGNGPAKIAAADLNNDGNVDLVTLNTEGTLSIFRGSGNGTFLAALTTPVAAGSSDFAIGDFTGDGKLDLAVPSSLGNTFSILSGNGDGTFSQLPATATSYSPNQLVAADFNNDGKLDLAITYRSFSSYAIFLGTGSGTFQPERLKALTNTGELTRIAAGQLNGDTKVDLVITSVEAFPSGIAAIHAMIGAGDGTFTEKPAIPIGRNPSALVLAHVDNDNRLDILTATNSGDQLELLYGLGDGTFSPTVTLTAPQSVTSINVSDFNNDGRGDIALTSYTAGLFTVFQQTAVTRAFIGAPANYFPGSGIPGSLATGDFDKDGKTDLAAGVHNSSLAISFKGDGAGHLTAKNDIPLTHTPTGILVTDLNQDGADDIVTNGDSTASISVALSNGNGTFPTPAAYTVYGAQYRTATGDFNGDGIPDLAVANYSNVVSILLGTGTGTFGSPTTFNAGISPHDIVSGDFNGDGKLDLIVSNMDATAPAINVLIGNGAGAFAAPIPYPVSARTDFLVTGDFNQDGKLDVAVNNFDTSTVSVMLGNGDGSFGAKTDFPAGFAPNDMIRVDLNNDGVPDVVTANGNGYISVLFGLGDGTLLPAIHYWTGNSTTVAAGSFTSSSRVDLAVGDALRGGVMLLLNTTQPSFESSYPQVIATTATTAQVLVKSTVSGRAYAVCLPDGSPAPSTAQIKAGVDATDAAVAAGMKGSTPLVAHTTAVIPLSTLTSGNSYNLYVILEDTLITAQPVPGFVSFTQPLTVPQMLTVSVSGIGTVYSSSATTGTPDNITCASGACSATYPEGSTVTLTASPSWYSTTSWGGDGSSSLNTASVVMNSGRNVTANFVAAQNVQLSSPAGYLGSIKLALGAATSGATIKALKMNFPDRISFSRSGTTITLLGGLTQLSDTSPSGFTTIPGPLLISGGKLIVKGGIRIQP